ncbi:MAG: sigma factor, partial [Planctomycetota bacterium]
MKDSWDGERDPLAALLKGRQGPFEAFVRAETRTLLGFFARLGAGRSEAEDLTQETFLKLYRLAVPDLSLAPRGTSGTPSAPAYQARGQFRGFAFRVAR